MEKTKPDDKMLQSLGIPELSEKKYADLSTGQKRRLHLALALIGNPDLIVLDEPTAGLDVEGRVSLHEQIRALKSQGKTILLASHDMAEVEDLCDRIAVLKDGNLVFVGTVGAFTAMGGKRHLLRIKTADGQETYETGNLTETLLAILTEYRRKGTEISEIQTDRVSLEQNFINLVRGAEE